LAEIEFLEALSYFLFESSRFKIAWGGRGAGKTEGLAEALILLSRTKKLRIICGREFQNSIDESVKQIIEYYISELGFDDEFIITSRKIEHKKTHSRFIFMGLRYNIQKIKSMGRIDLCWIEEADKTSKNTLDKLIPTIRGRSRKEEDRGGPFGKGPEIWISFNPDLEEDEVYKRFVSQKHIYAPDYVLVDNKTDEIVLNKDGSIFVPDPKDYEGNNEYSAVRYCISKKINYWDNKFFPPDLRMEMSISKASNLNKYLEVWEGNTKQVLEGAIYAEELRDVISERRRGLVRYDPNKPVYTFWDLGHNDKTAIWFVQRVGMEYNIIYYYENRLKKMPFYIGILQEMKYNYGLHYLPHDGDHETLSNVTPKKQLEKNYPKLVRLVERPSRKAIAINAVRSILPLCNFDETNTSEGWQCLSRYAYKVDDETGVFSREPEHDTPWSHGADAMTTLALSLKTEADAKKPKPLPSQEKTRVLNMHTNSNSWMG
jgi:phage terminase large subunit